MMVAYDYGRIYFAGKVSNFAAALNKNAGFRGNFMEDYVHIFGK